MCSQVVIATNAPTSGLSPFAIREMVEALTPISLANCRQDRSFSVRAASSVA